MEGIDLSPQLLRPADGVSPPGDEWPESVYLLELLCCDQAVREQILPWRGVRTARHTYARDLHGPWVLYDNLEDPYQQRSLIKEPSARPVLAEMEERLAGWARRLGDVLEPPEALLARLDRTEEWAAREAARAARLLGRRSR